MKYTTVNDMSTVGGVIGIGDTPSSYFRIIQASVEISEKIEEDFGHVHFYGPLY